jgi:hypothetical protein
MSPDEIMNKIIKDVHEVITVTVSETTSEKEEIKLNSRNTAIVLKCVGINPPHEFIQKYIKKNGSEGNMEVSQMKGLLSSFLDMELFQELYETFKELDKENSGFIHRKYLEHVKLPIKHFNGDPDFLNYEMYCRGICYLETQKKHQKSKSNTSCGHPIGIDNEKNDNVKIFETAMSNERNSVAAFPPTFWGNSFPRLIIVLHQVTLEPGSFHGSGSISTNHHPEGILLHGKELKCLRKNEYVNVQVIDAYIQVLNSKQTKYFCFNSGFNPLTEKADIWTEILKHWFMNVKVHFIV